MVYLLLLVSFAILIKGAEIFIEASSIVAKIFKIPELIIGVVIVGFGTSLPEFAVNMAAVAKNSNDMAIGNVVGSNIFNMMFIIGAIAIFRPMVIDEKLALFDFPMLMIAGILLPILALDSHFLPVNNTFSRVEGVIMLLVFAYYCKETIQRSVLDQSFKDKKMMIYQIAEGNFSLMKHFEESEAAHKPSFKNLFKDISLIVIGLICVVKGGDMVIEYASEIATNLGMSRHLVGLTIVGVGTSLPEFVVTIMAARKGKQNMVLGNVLGSNTFNILFILGMTMFLKPINVEHSMISDSVTLAFLTAIVGGFAIINKKIGKITGICFIAIYIAYMYLTVTA